MALTVQMIESKEFSVAAMGYKRKEVDEFLDEICDEMDRLHEEIAQLQMRLSKAGQGQTQVFKGRPGAVPAPSPAAQPMVPAPIEVVSDEVEEEEPAQKEKPVQQTTRPAAPVRQDRRPEAEKQPEPEPQPSTVAVDAAQILSKAQHIYDQTVAEAKKLYDEKVQAAQDEADRIVKEAEASLKDRNTRLIDEKTELEKSIKTLRSSAADYRTRLQALLTGQQKILDDSTDLFEEKQ